MNIPDGAKNIIDTLTDHGYEAYVVGGCVRDTLLGRKPNDWDITTSALPEEVKSIFRRTIDTGIKHGTVTILKGAEPYEVTTYRTDGEYADHRHPDSVTFTPSLREDLKRRDFTINAMAYNDTDGLIDLFGGEDDLKKGIIRCVGDPIERFDEDALRMLRCIRFSAQLLFDIDKKTIDAIRKKVHTLTHVSAERIQAELTKILISDGVEKLLLAYDAGLLDYFLPELVTMFNTPQHNPHHCFDVGRHTLAVIKNVKASAKDISKKELTTLSLAALLHDVAKPSCLTTDKDGIDHFHGHDIKGADMARTILKRLKYDNETISTVCTLIRYHDMRYEYLFDVSGKYNPVGKKAHRRFLHRMGVRYSDALFILQRADIMAQSEYKRKEKLNSIDVTKMVTDEIITDNNALSKDALAIRGRDLIALGLPAGPEIGKILDKLLDAVMDDPTLNTKEKLMNIVNDTLKNRI